MDPCHVFEKQEINTSKWPKLCLFLLQTILQSTSTLTLFILSLHLISVIPFVNSALKKTITAAQEQTLAQKNKTNKNTFVIWQQLQSPLVLHGHSLLVIPCHPGNPAMINSRLRFLLTAHTYSLLQFQNKPLGLVVQVNHQGLSLLSCPVIETNKSIWNVLYPSDMSFNIHIFSLFYANT